MKFQLRSILRAVWQSTAALIALILIVAAFVIGWLVGGEPGAETAASPTAASEDDSGPTTYTCSMHPSVRLPDADAKCPICFMDLIPVKDEGADAGPRSLVMSEAAMKLADVRTTGVQRFYPTKTVRLFGTVDYDETRHAMISAYFPGRVEELFVNYTGISVKKGEHLAAIYSPELIAAQEELQQARAALDEIDGASDVIRNSTRATLEAAHEKLRLWGLTAEQITELETADALMERLTIYSPMSGVVTKRHVTEGAYVSTGEKLFEVADLDQLWVRLEAYESQLPWLRYGQSVEFTTDSIPGEVFKGRISFIDPTLARATRTVHLRINVDNRDRRLKPGMYVRAVARSKIAGSGLVMVDELAGKWICPMHPEVIDDGPNACDDCGMPLVPAEELGYTVPEVDVDPPVVIPASAPLITGTRAVVYVKRPDAEKPTFEGREVVLGPRAGEWYIVREGLRPGEEVVTHGTFKIDSALQIAAKPSMMSPDEDGETAMAKLTRFNVPDGFLYSLKPVYSAYFDAQEALADDDLDAFRQSIDDLHTAIDLLDTSGVTGEPLGYWRRLSRRLLTDAEHIDHLAGLDAARGLFETYSNAMIEIEERFGHKGARPHYVSFCPMAFDNRGATWLARAEEIENPYFGHSMLRCGEVRAEFEPRDDDAGGDS